MNIKDYPNLLDSITQNFIDIENQIISYPLIFDRYKNKEVEWEIKLPMFVDTFYKIVLNQSKIPTQEELWNTYSSLSQVENIIAKRTLSERELILKGIHARLLRAYPSLVRDLHFSLFLKEHVKNKAKVIYNIKLDVEIGIDILIEHKDRLYAVNLFTPTRRARMAREMKDNRHKNVTNVIQIELPVEFKTDRKCGNFFLYGEKELTLLKQLIKGENLNIDV